MPIVSIKFSVTAPDTLRYWLAVDEQDIDMANGTGQVQLESGQQHILVWWMIGNSGDALSIVGKDGEREIVNIKESKVPASGTKGAGYRKFTP